MPRIARYSYYNDNDPQVCEWLRNLIRAGLIAPGVVDDRDIRLVQAADLRGFAQVHMFAGIAGWSYALRLAGWPDERPVWTGSCPCQPFSVAGKGKGFDDERHLWPEWFRLIRECRPVCVFGEQVSSSAGLQWLDAVSADLEGAGYAIGAADIPACGIGAPHRRQRLWFVADRVANAEGERSEWDTRGRREAGSGAEHAGELGHPKREGLARPSRQSRNDGAEQPTIERAGDSVGGFWRDAVYLPCRDGKARPVEPGLEPLAYRPATRMVRLRAYGNAIVPHVAAEFIAAYREVRGDA